ncbi:MAG: peptide-binding protein [Endomicrobiales bacterium]
MTAVLMIMACLSAGCRREEAPSRPVGGSGSPGPGDMYVASSIGDATYLNPVLATDSASGDINALVYNGLVKYDRDLKLVGDLAESWTVSADGLTITFTLRKDVLWHDGARFTADDVKFTYERLIDPKVRTPYGGDYLLVKELKVLDPRTVRVTYREPFAPALESWGMGIVPKHVFEKGDFNTNPANRAPVGTGPFMFRQWVTDEKILLDANPRYFEGKPFISRYVYRIIPDQAVQFLELRKQSIDEMGLTPDQWKAYPEFFRHYNKFRYPSFSYVYLGFNLKIPLFADVRFRRAVAHAVDKREIIDGVLLGIGKAATGPFPPQSWAHDPSVKDYPHDPDKARALLGELGWRDTNGDGYLDREGKNLEFTIITNQGNKMRSLTAEILQAQLRKVGIKVNVRIIEWSAFVHQFIDKRNFEAVIMGWSLSRDPDQHAIWHSGQVNEGQYNFVSYANPGIDRLLEQGRRTFDQKKREAVYHRIHRVMAEDLPYIFLYYPESLPVVHQRFRGPEVTPAGLGWNFYRWWVPKAEQKYEITQ